MIPLILTIEEARLALADKLTEIRRPVADLPQDPQNVRYLHGSYLKCDAPPGADTVSLRIACPWGTGWSGTDYEKFAQYLWGRESWRSWVANHCDDCCVQPCNKCRETVVDYESTPLNGYRPFPDRAYLEWGSPPPAMWSWWYEEHQKLPWQSAEAMPLWASRFAFRNRGVRVEKTADIWMWVVTIERVNKPNTAPVPPVELEGTPQ